MARRRKRLLIALLVIVLLPVGFVAMMRLSRGRHDPPVAVHGEILRMRNLFTEIYGTRVGNKIVLFDAGIDTAGDALDALTAALHGTRDDVSDVFLTHGHFDHVAVSPLCTRARIHVGAEDVEMLAHRVPYEPAAARWFSRVLPVGPIEATDRFVARTEVPLPDGRKLLAIPLPGHTPGSYVFYLDGVLLAGDSLQISDGKLSFAQPRFSVDMEANRHGVAGLKEALAGAPVSVVCTGHQGCTAEGEGGRLLDELMATAR
jgi:glyoxylase-like metal-dependent hydrolase (beta-lactamase superfamily II)